MEWISNRAATLPDASGVRVDEAPGLWVGAGCRYQTITDRGTCVLLAGQAPPLRDGGRALLDAAEAGRWADLTHLPGSYWVIARHRDGHTFVCGDLAGFRTVFWTINGSHLAWSTSSRHLATAHHKGLDLAHIAARLVAGPEHWPTATTYQDVFQVPGGYGLFVRADGTHHLIDVRGTAPCHTLAEGAPAFGDALRTAVGWRAESAQGVVGVDVSGGLDSSSLAILASTAGEIRAVTYHDAHTSTEDLTFARRTAEHMGVELHVGEGSITHLPFGWRRGQPVTDQPAAASMTMAQHHLYLAPAAGLPLHLTGNGGDVVLDSCSAVWVAMVQRSQRRLARRQVTNWARARNRAPRQLWQAVTRAADLGHAGALTQAATDLTSGHIPTTRPGVWSWCHLGTSATWLTETGRELVAHLLDQAAHTATEGRADLAEQQMSLRLVGADARETLPLARAWQVRPSHPFLDNQVVQAAFAIDPEERHGRTTFKPLLAAALPELPTWLTDRRSKGSFTRQLTTGIRHHERALAHLIRTNTLVTGGLLDPEPALHALAQVTDGHAHALYDLQRLIMTCHWLTHHDQPTRPHPETGC